MKKIYHNRAKHFTFLRRFDRVNTVFGISRNLIDQFVFKCLLMQENYALKNSTAKPRNSSL